ncbi:adenosylhomocysteinase [Candidatus Woesearchaeota archaeon CG07_land_8_20_14_0_80_44_23]|nr:MAG: adenosylhomocysteinase [Candidatus Woesearchaeota archaeon CG07_land_8_20_14_0_80_44_23]
MANTKLEYKVKDISLAEQGRKNIAWAETHMKALLEVRKRFEKEKPFKGIRIGMALHVTKETAVLVKTLIAGGADVAICSCNPLSTQDDVAAALALDGIKVYAWKGETTEEYYQNLRSVVAFKPQITIDDGCDLVNEIHTKNPELIKDIVGGCEETTTGVIRLKAMRKEGALKYPVIAVNDNKTKHLVDNYYGTGQSALDGVIRATNVLFAGKTVVVVGYGDCGKGVSLRAKGLGANVIVTEADAFRALQAHLDGFRVMPISEASKIGDIFITVTGGKHVISSEHMNLMKDGAILANAGHFNVEIDVESLKKTARSVIRIRPFIDEYSLANGRRIYICAEGRLVNLAAAEGHPSEVMSMSFCGEALAVEHLLKNRGRLPVDVIQLPADIDDKISRLQLKVSGIEIDSLTEEQRKYISEWREGT